MARHALPSIAVAAAIFASPGMAMADGPAGGCAFVGDPDAPLDRVTECMRMGRHVRVESSISRGTATLGEGMTQTGLRDGAQRRVRVPTDPLNSLFSGFLAR